MRLSTNLDVVNDYDEISEVITMLWTQDAISAEIHYRDEALRRSVSAAAAPSRARRARRRVPRSNRGGDALRWTALFPLSSKEHG
ncbi:MAG: hypothetical protein J2O49_02370 [Sciscionella sp.]|nr:hypothetical protein [Sciscionella sp.]